MRSNNIIIVIKNSNLVFDFSIVFKIINKKNRDKVVVKGVVKDVDRLEELFYSIVYFGINFVYLNVTIEINGFVVGLVDKVHFVVTDFVNRGKTNFIRFYVDTIVAIYFKIVDLNREEKMTKKTD